MNKYQEALDYLKGGNLLGELSNDALEGIEELVDKATPMRLIQKIDSSHGEVVNLCPICGALNFDDKEYHTCWRCGQAIDWSKE